MRNLFEETLTNQANRLAERAEAGAKELGEILPEDLLAYVRNERGVP